MDPYLVGLLLSAAGGLQVRRAKDTDARREGTPRGTAVLGLGPWEVPLLPFFVLLLLTELVLLVNKATYAAYFDSPLVVVWWLVPYLAFGMVIELFSKSATYQARRFLLLLCLCVAIAAGLAPSLAPMGPEISLAAIWVLFALVALFTIYKAADSKLKMGKFYTAAAAVALLLPTVAGFATPAYPAQNGLFGSLEAHQTTAMPDHWISNTTEIRVISWLLATQYLHRAYGEAASYLDTDDDTLARYTDPSVVDGRFVWVNAPVFESLKWFGDRDHPQFVYIDNVPENMSLEEPNVIHKVNQTIDYHMERIEWGKRISQRLFDRYNEYLVVQSRVDLDDSGHLYFVIYLGRVPLGFAMPNLEKVLIIDPTDGSEQAFDVTDPAIPAWLEVVYPDWYVYEWVSFWAHSRFGWYYTWTNKQHLYEPDDSSARFLIINGTSYWQVPLRQQDSRVLGGYVIVNTRTGQATFYNREVRSMADTSTAMLQVATYLTSGELGFQQLVLHEGYLYPFRMASGDIREAYVFPLYAGFTIAKYAVLDAVEYTSPPVIAERLADAVAQYRAHAYGVPGQGGGPAAWQNVSIQNAYVGKDPTSSQEEVVFTFNNTTYVVTMQELRGGEIARGEDEWRELNLAVAEFQRTGAATVWVALAGDAILDVDYEASSLVTRG